MRWEGQALRVASVPAIFRCAIQETNASYQLFGENAHNFFIGVLLLSSNRCMHPKLRAKDQGDLANVEQAIEISD
jgi:hypothetical protein